MTDIVERLREWAKSIRRKPTPLIEAIPMVSCAADEIETLRRQLAEKDAEIERLKEEVRVTKEEDFPRKVKAVANNWRIKLAASQAREAKLREALSTYAEAYDHHWESGMPILQPLSDEILALPTDDTALRELVDKAVEVMRERICDKVEGSHTWITREGASYMVRALPAVTLEDLK